METKEKKFKLRTKHGYSFFDVASAFQKSIRRCDEVEAMFWAVELYESNFAKYAWKRLIIMASEDVGLGDPFHVVKIMALYQSYQMLEEKHEKSQPEKLPFTQAVLASVHAKKSRYVDLAISVYWDQNETVKKEIPDYAYDMHTYHGKKMGRGMDHFYKEGALINNANKLPNEEQMEELAKQVDKKNYGKGKEPKKEDTPEFRPIQPSMF